MTNFAFKKKISEADKDLEWSILVKKKVTISKSVPTALEMIGMIIGLNIGITYTRLLKCLFLYLW